MKRQIVLSLFCVVAFLGCAKETVVQIGAVLPLSGDWAIYGQAVEKGIELAYSELAAQEGSPYRLTVVDTESDPAKAKELIRQQYEDGAIAVIGGVISDEALQSVPIAEEYDRVLLSPSASNPELTGISKYFYRVFISDAREGTTMANFATQKLKIPSVAILAKETAYAQGIKEVFRTEFERQGGEVLEVIEFPEGSELTGLVDRVITLDPGAVYIAAFAEDSAEMITALREKNYQGAILTTSAFSTPDVIERVGDAANGVYLTQSLLDLESDEPHIKAFVDAFQAKNSLTPDLYAAHGYDALKVIAAASETSDLAAPDFWRALRSLRDFSGVTGTIQFDERGDVQKFPRVYVVSNGDLLDYDAEVTARREEILKKLRELEQKRLGN